MLSSSCVIIRSCVCLLAGARAPREVVLCVNSSYRSAVTMQGRVAKKRQPTNAVQFHSASTSVQNSFNRQPRHDANKNNSCADVCRRWRTRECRLTDRSRRRPVRLRVDRHLRPCLRHLRTLDARFNRAVETNNK